MSIGGKGTLVGSAYVRLGAEDRGLSSSITKARTQFHGLGSSALGAGRDTTHASRMFGSTGRSLTGMIGAIGGVTLAYMALRRGFQMGLDELKETQAQNAMTAAGIKSTGGAANVTAKHVESLAGALLNKSGVDDQVIQSGENMLLTFTKVRNEAGKGNDIFDRATKSALDLSVRGFGSMEGMSKMLGKALQDPVKGMAAMSKAGVTFTQGQKDSVKAMVASGNILGAQKMILKEVENQVGGSAEAYGKTLPGMLGKAKEALSGWIAKLMSFKFDAVVKGVTGFVKALKDFAATKEFQKGLDVAKDAASKLGDALQTVGTWISDHRELVAEFGVALGAIAVTVGLVSAAMSIAAALNPFGLVIIGVAALAAALIHAYRHSKTFRDICNDSFAAVKKVAVAAFDAIRPALSRFGALLKSIGQLVSAVVRGDWGDAWKALKSIATNYLKLLWEAVKLYLRYVVTVIKNVVPAVISVAAALGKGIYSGITSAISGIAGAVGDKLEAVPGALSKILGRARDKAGQVGGAIKSGISGALNGIGDALQNTFRAAINKLIGVANKAITKFNALPGVPNRDLIGKLAGGGRAAAGKPYLVGERGMELWIPDTSGTMVPTRDLRNMGGGTTNVSITIDTGVVGLKPTPAQLTELGNLVAKAFEGGKHRRRAYSGNIGVIGS